MKVIEVLKGDMNKSLKEMQEHINKQWKQIVQDLKMEIEWIKTQTEGPLEIKKNEFEQEL